MWLCASEKSLVFLPSLLTLGLALPFKAEVNAYGEHLLRRATYSVVPVDGGSSSTPSDSPVPTTVFQTITVPAAPITTTVVEVDVSTFPGTTEVIVSIKTIEDTTTAVVTSYSIVDISAPTVTVTEISVVSATAPSISTLSITSPSTTSPVILSSTTTTTSATTSSPGFSVTTPIITISCTSTLTSGIFSAIGVSTPNTSSSTSQSFDDGQWHTTYNHWLNTTATAASTFKSIPTPVTNLPANSIPVDNSDQDSSFFRKRGISHLIRKAISNAFRLL